MHDFVVKARDFKAGTIDSFLFNERNWMVRYFVVDTERWLPGRQVLVSPVAIEKTNWKNSSIKVFLTKEEIENSPDIDSRNPISRQKEAEYANYFNWPIYWRLLLAPPPGASPVSPEDEELDHADRTNLRSSAEVSGYRVRGTDGFVGHVEDFIVNDEYWKIMYLVIGIGDWAPERKVLASSAWVTHIDWARRLVHVDLDKSEIGDSPEYEPGKPLDREMEDALFDHHGRPKYWETD